MLKEKIAFFDFCETLVNFQTADAFVNFVREESNKKSMICFEIIQLVLRRLKLIRIVDFLTKNKASFNKRIKLFQLRGFSKDELERYAQKYYQLVIKPNFINDTISLLIELRDNGWKIVIVSGGYDIYLKEFAKEYGVVKVLSTKIEFKKGICTGKMLGKDCLRNNKVEIMNNNYDSRSIISKSFSDSITDVPFLKWADEGYVVSKNKHQKWVDNYEFNEIIW